MKVVFTTPYITEPTAPFIKALEDCLPAIENEGWEHQIVCEIGNPYISAARAIMTRKALDAKADVIVYLDYDVSWSPSDMVKLLDTKEHVVAGTYRFKTEKEEYMGAIIPDDDNQLRSFPNKCLKAGRVPAGFLKVTAEALNIFAKTHPHLLYGNVMNPHLDLFNHGAHEGIWWGEDYAFSRRWTETGHDLWIRPDLDITHHSKDNSFVGNFHNYLLAYKGDEDEA